LTTNPQPSAQPDPYQSFYVFRRTDNGHFYSFVKPRNGKDVFTEKIANALQFTDLADADAYLARRKREGSWMQLGIEVVQITITVSMPPVPR